MSEKYTPRDWLEFYKVTKEALEKKEQIITAKTPENKEIVFEMNKIREHWHNFYKEHNLQEIADSLPEQITLSQEQIQRIQELSKEQGFDTFILLPPNPDQYLDKLKQETSDKELAGLSEKKQYDNKKTYLSGTVKPNFPDKIKTINRPCLSAGRPKDKPYLLFLKSSLEVPDDTREQSASDLREQFKKNNLNGLTLSEYFIFQRNYTKTRINDKNPHPDAEYWTWLLDSELSETSSGAGQVLRAYWHPDDQQVLVDSDNSSYQHSSRGARSSAMFEL